MRNGSDVLNEALSLPLIVPDATASGLICGQCLSQDSFSAVVVSIDEDYYLKMSCDSCGIVADLIPVRASNG